MIVYPLMIASNAFIMFTYYLHDRTEFGDSDFAWQITAYTANAVFANAEVKISILFVFLLVNIKIRFRAINEALR